MLITYPCSTAGCEELLLVVVVMAVNFFRNYGGGRSGREEVEGKELEGKELGLNLPKWGARQLRARRLQLGARDATGCW
jgi:hypothetical protein